MFNTLGSPNSTAVLADRPKFLSLFSQRAVDQVVLTKNPRETFFGPHVI